MKDNKKLLLVVGGILVLVGVTASLTYAFMSVADKQSTANIFNTNKCLNISIENESDAINLTNTYPITDLEGLESSGYTFTIKNTCSSKINYQVNLESLNETTNTLNANYIKVALSSDTSDNLISILSNNTKIMPSISNAYEAYNLYTGELAGNSSKSFKLREWMDYDTTKEQGASKTYTSKINIIANPDLEVISVPEVKTTIDNFTLTGNITGSASTAKYCTTSDNICTPSTNISISNNSLSTELNRDNKQIICMQLDNGKISCSDVIDKLVLITIPDIIATLNPKDSATTFSGVATTDEGVYAVSDGMYGGTSYYWRGAVTNNYVKFANFCWRIIRINGDGSIRLIYDGTTCHPNGTSTTDSLIQPTSGTTTYTYNASYNQSNYVGWTYSRSSQRTLSGTASNAKTQTEKWFDANITGTNLSKVDTSAKYCNDRDAQSGSTWAINGSTFYYAAYKRTYTDRKPTLSCPSGDTYTIKVGAITADEVMYAGGWNANNTSYYLYNGQNYWTMSPYNWNGGDAIVFYVASNGSLDGWDVDGTRGLRSVINLKADTLFLANGDGTLNNPYVVQ